MVVRTNTLRKYTAKRRRRGTANTTKVRYQRPTARNQRKQIMTNARAVKSLYRLLPKRVFCDWQRVGTLNAALDAGSYTTTWGCFPLTNYSDWQPVLRVDANVAESSTTFVQRLSINMRYTLQASSWAQYNVWIVTSRRDSSQRDWPASIAAGTNPVEFTDYIEGPNAFNLRLNPALFKVHFATYKTLTETTLFQSALPLAPAGNPNTTWSKGQANIRCGINVRQPTSTDAWNDVPYMQQAFTKRYFLLLAVVQNAPTAVLPGGGARFDFDQLATTINSS